jgi:hypothetical protein
MLQEDTALIFHFVILSTLTNLKLKKKCWFRGSHSDIYEVFCFLSCYDMQTIES